jgi:uncharacterized protein (TIGR04255 family)
MTTTALGTWKKPPLAYVVAEIIISPHYGLRDAVPSFQQSLRKEFPRTLEGKELVIDGNNPPVTQEFWRLLSADQTRGIHIGPRAISLHATSYSNSTDFFQRWLKVLSTIEATNLDAYVERAGLRYIDLIVPTEGHRAKDYLAPGLQGVPPPAGGSILDNIWAVSYQINEYTVYAKTASPSPLGNLLPPNFVALPLQKPQTMIEAEQMASEHKEIGFIDTDCSCEVNRLFNSKEIGDLHTTLHSKVSATFKSLISELARNEWI